MNAASTGRMKSTCDPEDSRRSVGGMVVVAVTPVAVEMTLVAVIVTFVTAVVESVAVKQRLS